jgi:hypothetical protein
MCCPRLCVRESMSIYAETFEFTYFVTLVQTPKIVNNYAICNLQLNFAFFCVFHCLALSCMFSIACALLITAIRRKNSEVQFANLARAQRSLFPHNPLSHRSVAFHGGLIVQSKPVPATSDSKGMPGRYKSL